MKREEMAEKECQDIRHKLEREVGVVTGVDLGIYNTGGEVI